MALHRTILLSILALVCLLNLTAQNTPLEVYAHDNYTDHPLESVLVSVLLNGVVIDSAYTNVNGVASLAGVTSVKEPVGLPSSITLSHNYPNPFRDDTNVEIGIPEAQTITAAVYNILGQRVASEQLPVVSGYYTLNLSLGHLPTGVYFLRIEGRESQAIKLLKMGRGIHPSGPVFSISGGSFPGGATIGKSAEDEYTVRAVKDRYDVYQAVLEQPLRSGVAVPLARNNIVEFVVVDGNDNPVTKQLELKTTNYQSTITTPQTLTLKSGVYRAMGEVEQGISLERTVEIPSVDTTVVLTFENAGVKLEGAPDAPATDATYDLYIPIVYPEETISVDPDLMYDGRVLRTEIEVVLNPDVTISEVNGLLDKYNAQIVSMLEGNTIFIIRVPDPGDVASLNQLVADIENEPIVLIALKSVIVEDPEPVYDSYAQIEIQEIPVHIDTLHYNRIDHHLASRAHAAWNLRDAITGLSNRPWIVIGDIFGDGAPGSGYNALFTNTDFAAVDTNSHGYHVLGIITGMYDRVSSLTVEQNNVVGMFPERLRVRAVDLSSTDANTWPRRANLIINRINDIITSDPNARIIVNTSLNSRVLSDQYLWAITWIIRVRGGLENIATIHAGYENRFIHFTAAGNNWIVDGDIISWDAQDNSFFAYAVLGDVMMPGISIPNLTNTFVVENRVNTLHHDTDTQRQRPLPGCAINRSIMGGNLSAMGTEVWSFGASIGGIQYSDPRTSFKSGTSMATPQAAGVAAYVWSVNPNLSVTEVMDIIRSTAEARATNTLTPGVACNEVMPQPVIDAYAAVLAAGGANARRILLDVKGSGVFDHNDIEEFLSVYLDTLKAGKLDYSRYDLNGDGFTGGDSTGRFDLTVDGQYSEVQKNIEGTLIKFDENKLTDLEILCYYSYSDLYRGDETRRNELLGDLCACLPVTDIDGNVYQTIQIGDQCWMAENLKTSRYRDGSSIPNVTGREEWSHLIKGAWAYYDNNPSNDATYGKLYNWFAVDDSRGLCPEDWRVPSDGDWTALENYLGGPVEAGGKMKSTELWNSPNSGATNKSGWSGLPGGYRSALGFFYHNARHGLWWSSSEYSIYTYDAWSRELYYHSRHVNRLNNSKRFGLSVRCLRND